MSSTENMMAVLGQGGNLPAFVGKANAKALNQEAAKGTSSGESIPRISLKQSRFRLIVNGEQVKVFDESYLDLVFLRANPEASKVLYLKKYDPGAEDQMPDCWSDNGIHPSPDVEKKQSRWCRNCPKNAWGSKISEMSGKKVKACTDTKRIAVVPATRLGAMAYQLSVPAASLGALGSFLSKLGQIEPAIPYNGIVIRVKFDPEADHPKLEFEPVQYLTDEQYAEVSARYDAEDVKRVATVVPVTDPEPEGLERAVVPDDAAEPETKSETKSETKPEPEELTPEQLEAARKREAALAAKQQAADDWGDAPGATVLASDAAAEPEPKKGKASQVADAPQDKVAESAADPQTVSGSAVDAVFGDDWDD